MCVEGKDLKDLIIK